MKRIKFLLTLTLLFGIAIGNLSAQTGAGTPLKLGDKAPEFKVAAFLKGEPLTGFEKGKVYVVEFWATWCQPCLANIPHLSAIAEKYAGKGLSVYGVSVMERTGVSADSMQRFIQNATGAKMKYNVAWDGEGALMKKNWLDAAEQRGIPFAFVVDQEGRIAWKGYPASLDKVLPAILDRRWDIVKQAAEEEDNARLAKFDGNEVVKLLNPYMGKDYPGAMRVLDSLLEKEPRLLYFPKFGHFRTYSLLATDTQAGIEYARTWWANSDFPAWSTVSDAVSFLSRRMPEKLTKEVYLLGIEALQAQLEAYPWSMNFKATYQTMAEYYEKAGMVDKAQEYRTKAENTPAPAGRNN